MAKKRHGWNDNNVEGRKEVIGMRVAFSNEQGARERGATALAVKIR